MRQLSVAEQRYLAVLAVIEDGLSVTEGAPKAFTPSNQVRVDTCSRVSAGQRGVATSRQEQTLGLCHADPRGEVLADREVYDGCWSRNVGPDGGQTLAWTGRIVLVGATTTAYDSARSVIAAPTSRGDIAAVDQRHRGFSAVEISGVEVGVGSAVGVHKVVPDGLRQW